VFLPLILISTVILHLKFRVSDFTPVFHDLYL
jgi:hypothetical protein